MSCSQRILVVDDEPNFLRGVQRRLRDEFDVVTADSGRAGLRCLQEAGPIAVVVSDYRMPEMDGIEFLRQARKVAPATIRVMLTQYADEDVAIAALNEAQVGRFLEKPCPPRVLTAALRDCLEQYRLAMREAALIAELQQTNEELQAANLRLEGARAAADAANSAKSAFLTAVSHEVRTPMTAILGFAQMLEEASLPPDEQRRALATIRRNGEHLLRMINDLLDLGSLSSGHFTVRRVPCEAGAVLAEVMSLLQLRAERKGLYLGAECAPPVPQVILTDPGRLRQILTNLVANAIAYTDEGGVRVRVHLNERAGPQPRLCFQVIDTGRGIRPEDGGRLFEPFVRLGTQDPRTAGGTGLGLSISQRLAGLLGGEIICESAPGRGSVFSVTIQTGPLTGVPLLEEFPETRRWAASATTVGANSACREGQA
jgi:signal transduction histidine kinase